MKLREAGVKESMGAAKDAVEKGENDAAITLYKAVLDQQCLFPKYARDAAKEPKKLGVASLAVVADAPNYHNKALALLKRHFCEYERSDAVRSKEMMEARVDAVFASIVADFVCPLLSNELSQLRPEPR